LDYSAIAGDHRQYCAALLQRQGKHMNCRIEHFVRESVASLDEGATIQEAVGLMADQNVGSLVVTRNDKVVGLFTERDLVKRVVGAGKQPGVVTLGEVATTGCLITVAHDTSCKEAINKMRSNSCRRLLVYRGNHFMGLVNLPSLAFALTEDRSGRNMLASVFVAVAVAVAISVIIVLILLLPDMLDMAQSATTH
jgi:CBS domain-containing protein